MHAAENSTSGDQDRVRSIRDRSLSVAVYAGCQEPKTGKIRTPTPETEWRLGHYASRRGAPGRDWIPSGCVCAVRCAVAVSCLRKAVVVYRRPVSI